MIAYIADRLRLLQRLFIRSKLRQNLQRLKTLTPVVADLLLAFLVVVVFYLTASLSNRSALIIDAYLYLSLLEDEIRICMALLGVNRLSALDSSYLHAASPVRPAHVTSAFPLLDEEGY